MKKFLLIAIVSFVSSISFSQLISGTLVDDNRKLISAYDFKVKGDYTGVKYFELAVNIQGKVTGIKEIVKENSFVSTPAKIIVQKELKQLVFEEGTHFPKFHHVLLKVEFVKQ